jgi:hypothetical protein
MHTQVLEVTQYVQVKLQIFLVTFTNIGAIGIVTNALFFMFLCQKILILQKKLIHFDDNVHNISWKHV